ncbi:transcriptional regulator of glmS gene DeoR family [Vibrio astriarenae]|nr:transcriptional regulator of glmS gene DeoR family [Vibrio sp. C7]
MNEKGEVSVEELSAQFETSEVTIRKDLASLEKNGQLLRRYGGAIALPKEVVTEELTKMFDSKGSTSSSRCGFDS